MRRLIQRLYDTNRYESLVDKDRARMVYAMASLVLVIIPFYLAFSRNSAGVSMLQRLGSSPGLTGDVAIFTTAVVASLVLTRLGRLQIGSILLVLAWYLPLTLPSVQEGFYNAQGTISLIIVVLLSGLLLGTRGLVGGTVVGLVSVIAAMNQRNNVPVPTSFNNSYDAASFILGLSLISGFTFLFLRFLRLSRSEAAAGEREDRLKLAELTTQVSQRISRRMALN
ncbi:MAG: hypothetical protein K8I30_09815, partial [Anaerolineae bacterium]|nr:hypothetical protein [Anaerolineae bacterium]